MSFTTYAALPALSLALIACVAEPDDLELGDIEQALTQQTWAFDAGYGEGSLSPMPPVRTEVIDGLLGWEGEWTSTPFGSMQLAAFKTTSDGAGTKGGRTYLQWQTTRLPASGNWDVTSFAPIRVRGYTYVKGTGNYFTSIDARAWVTLEITVRVNGNWRYGQTYQVGSDETKSESRRKNFSKDYYLSSGPSFGAFEGDYVDLEVKLYTSAWSNSDGSATAGIVEFGMPSAVVADTIVSLDYAPPL